MNVSSLLNKTTFLNKSPKLIIFLSLFAILSIPMLIWIPQRQVQSISPASPKERIEAENSCRETLLKILGGFFVCITAYSTVQNIQNTRNKDIVERFEKAFSQLEDEKQIHIRLGGIYSLQRIAEDAREGSWNSLILESLVNFVRGKRSILANSSQIAAVSSKPLGKIPKIDTDIQAALTVIGKLNEFNHDYNYVVDLSQTDLRYSNFNGASLRRANFNGAALDGAKFRSSKLCGATLCGATLCGADLDNADLTEADLTEANFGNFPQANLGGANLRGVNFKRAKLFEADFTNANFHNNPEIVKSAENWEEAIYEDKINLKLGLKYSIQNDFSRTV